jgi:hypothetical protein
MIQRPDHRAGSTDVPRLSAPYLTRVCETSHARDREVATNVVSLTLSKHRATIHGSANQPR